MHYSFFGWFLSFLRCSVGSELVYDWKRLCGKLLQNGAFTYPVIKALQAMWGIQFITAVGLISELGDLTRFEHPRQLMSCIDHTDRGSK